MRRTDEQIKKDITNQLYWDGRVNASDVKVEVSEGKVTLTGSVPSYKAKEAAADDACCILGVKLLNNDLKVALPEKITAPEDDELKAYVEESLMNDQYVKIEDIKVSVTAGWITLEGTVENYWHKTRAENIVSYVVGVTGITNELAVVPSGDFVDKDIAKDIVQAMERNMNVEAEKVNVAVKDGKVTLSGTVSTWAEYYAAYNSAIFTSGVSEVEDKLIINIE